MTTPSPNTELPPGPIDIHCHLLPGVDDGCPTIEDTIECIRLLKEAGYVGSILTPHILPEKFPDNTPDKLAPKFQQLQQQLREAGVDYPIWLGGEVTARDYTLEWLKANGVPTLAGSRYVLMDVWGSEWHSWLIPLFRWMMDQGYQPILAHPERYKGWVNQIHLMADLKQMGVMLQGNFPCLVGKYGPEIESYARQLLEADLYDFMATDGHKPGSFPLAFQGREIFIALQGHEALQDKTVRLPRKILGL